MTKINCKLYFNKVNLMLYFFDEKGNGFFTTDKGKVCDAAPIENYGEALIEVLYPISSKEYSKYIKY